MIQTVVESLKRKHICPSCGENWLQLEQDMKEPNELMPTWNEIMGYVEYEFIWQRSFNHQRAIELIDKCSACQEHFKGGH